MHTHLRTMFLLVSPKWCPGRDLNPHSPCGEKDFKSFASADFATRAGEIRKARYAAFHVHHNKRLN